MFDSYFKSLYEIDKSYKFWYNSSAINLSISY